MSSVTQASNLSVIQALNDIIDKSISKSLPTITNDVLLFKSGSTLTPVNLGQVSY